MNTKFKSRRPACVIFAVIVLQSCYVMAAHCSPAPAASVAALCGDQANLEWGSPRSGRDGIEYKVTDKVTGRRALVIWDAGGGHLRSYSLEGSLPSLQGAFLSQEALITEARKRLAQVLPASYTVSELACEYYGNDRGVVCLFFHGVRNGIQVPPSLVLRITADGRTVSSFGVGAAPNRSLKVGDTQVGAEEACELALKSHLAALSKQTGYTPARIQEEAAYQVKQPPTLYYPGQVSAKWGFSSPPAIWAVLLERTKPVSTRDDSLPDAVTLLVDANTGKTAVPPGIAGQMQSVTDKSAQPLVAYALAALAGLLVVFLVVKLRKR